MESVLSSLLTLLTTIICWVFQHFINSPTEWLRMNSFYYSLKKYKSRNKSRFDLNQVTLDAKPSQNGVLPHLEEQILEYPNHGKNERVFIYGTNSSGDLLILRLETRSIESSSVIRGQIVMRRSSDSTLYTFDETDWNAEYTNKYRIKGLTVEVVSPLRKLRITFRGIMTGQVRKEEFDTTGSDGRVRKEEFDTTGSDGRVRKEEFDTTGSDGEVREEIFVKFNFFWTPFSGAIDGKYTFDPRLLSKDLSETCSRKLDKNVSLVDMLEDRYEQYGQMNGLVSIENKPEEEVFLWGSRYKVFIQDRVRSSGSSSGSDRVKGSESDRVRSSESDQNESLESDERDSETSSVLGAWQSMRLLAMSSLKGPAVSLGHVSSEKCSYRYGSGFTIPPVAWTVTETSICGQDLDQLLHLEENGKVKEYRVSCTGKRDFDMRVRRVERVTSDIVMGRIELKGHEATCILVDERNGLLYQKNGLLYQRNGPLYDHIPLCLNPLPQLMSLEVSSRREARTSEFVYSLADVNGAHPLSSGGKGSSLVILTEIASSFLSSLPFKVPKGVVVSTKSYKYLLDNDKSLHSSIQQLQKKVWSTDFGAKSGSKNEVEEESQNVMNRFKSSPLPDLLTEHLRRKLHRIFGDFESVRFSVRSSAVGEDGEEMSAAGQMETYLGVKGIESITSCIMKCWSSQFTSIALNYRKNYGQLIDVNMSVVIQEMVNCDSAGVMFTVDPLTGNEKNILITSNYGLGESVVSASAEPDTITLQVDLKSRSVNGIQSKKIGSKSTQIKLVEREIGSKSTQIKLVERDLKEESGEKKDVKRSEEESKEKEEETREKRSFVDEDEGTETQSVDEEKSSVCSITDEEAIRLGRIGLLLHDVWRSGRDIEWGIKDGVIHLFQSRPVTNLDRYSEWELMHELDSGQPTEREYVTRANVGEVLPGAMSHLCHTFVISGWGVPGFARFKHIMGAKDDMFIPYILSFFAVVNNTFFINLKNKHFAFGTEEGAGTEYAILGHRLTDKGYLRDVADYYSMDPKNSSRWFNLKMSSFVLKEAAVAKMRLRKYRKQLEDFQLVHPGQLFDSSQDLFHHILDNSWQNNYGMLLHGQVTTTSILSSQILRAMLSRVNPDMDQILLDLSTILSQCSDVVSAGVPAQIKTIMDSIQDPEHFNSLSDEDALSYLSENTDTGNKFHHLLEQYGHRGLKEFDPHTKVWAMDPMPLIKSLKASSAQKTGVNGPTANGQLKPKNEPSANKLSADKLSADKPSTDRKAKGGDLSIDETLDRLHTKTSGFLRAILKHVVIPFARGSVGWREESKSFAIWLIHRYRVAFWILADQMSRVEGRIPDPDLLFYFKLEEIATLVKERDPTMVDRAVKRRKVMKIMDKFRFDEITKGPSVKPRREVTRTVPGGSSVLKGTPVCAGKVEARVCVAVSLEDAADIQDGDILITYSTDIGWSPFFPLLSGLATEIGGLVSHGAVIAREFGLPCLVGIEGAPLLFKTGDRALLDSVAGTITKL